MPKLKKKSSGQNQREDQLRKRQSGNCGTTRTLQKEPKSTNVTNTFHNKPSSTNAVTESPSHSEMCGALHEYSFFGIDADDVLEGEIDIRIMDYTSQLLRVQFQCRYGMLPPSYLHYLVTNGEAMPVKIPAGVKAIQMHYISGHYVLSARERDSVHVFDSLPNQNRLHQVIPQLQLLYENFDCNSIKYTTPQHQGLTSLCGIFVVANAVFLFNNMDPHEYNLLPNKMRSYFKQCLIASEITVFPTEEFSTLLHACIVDQTGRNNKKNINPNSSEIAEKLLPLKSNKAQRRRDPKYRDHENDLRRKRRANDASRRDHENDLRRKRMANDASRRDNENDLRRKRRANDASRRDHENDLRRKRRANDASRRDHENDLRRKRRANDASRRDHENDLRRKRRANDSSRHRENEIRKAKRQNVDYKKSENLKRNETRQEKRQDESVRNSENLKRNETRQEKRRDERVRNSEKKQYNNPLRKSHVPKTRH